jgi:hypothetical protein
VRRRTEPTVLAADDDVVASHAGGGRSNPNICWHNRTVNTMSNLQYKARVVLGLVASAAFVAVATAGRLHP